MANSRTVSDIGLQVIPNAVKVDGVVCVYRCDCYSYSSSGNRWCRGSGEVGITSTQLLYKLFIMLCYVSIASTE